MHTLYKNWCYYNEKEKHELMEEMKEIHEFDYEPTNEELEDLAQYEADNIMAQIFLEDCSLYKESVEVIGTLGLWDGTHDIIPEHFSDLEQAIYKIIGNCNNYQEFYEDRYGNMHAIIHHHDGINRFVIKKSTEKGLRCLHFRKEIYGIGKGN